MVTDEGTISLQISTVQFHASPDEFWRRLKMTEHTQKTFKLFRESLYIFVQLISSPSRTVIVSTDALRGYKWASEASCVLIMMENKLVLLTCLAVPFIIYAFIY